MMDEATASSKAKRLRSPAYPAIALSKAVDRAREFWEREKRHPAPIPVAAAHWGFKSKSSGGLVTVAALKQFGLLQDSGTGHERKVQLTEVAQRIILDDRPDSEERSKLLRDAALRPRIHAELWGKWGADLPSDATINSFLVLERDYNRDTVPTVIREYKDTISFARLAESDTVSVSGGDADADLDDMGSTGRGGSMMGQDRTVDPPVADGSRHQQVTRGREQEFAYCPLGIGRGARVLFQGEPTQGDIDDVIAYLNIAKRRLPKDTPTDDGEA